MNNEIEEKLLKEGAKLSRNCYERLSKDCRILAGFKIPKHPTFPGAHFATSRTLQCTYIPSETQECSAIYSYDVMYTQPQVTQTANTYLRSDKHPQFIIKESRVCMYQKSPSPLPPKKERDSSEKATTASKKMYKKRSSSTLVPPFPAQKRRAMVCRKSQTDRQSS